MTIAPRDPFSEFVDERRKITPDWYSWLTELIEELAGLQSSLGIFNVKDYGAVGDYVADDTAAIQAAIDAAPYGAMLYFPPGGYRVIGSGAACLTITQPLHVVGASELGSTVFADATVPNTRDIFHVVPSSPQYGYAFRFLAIRTFGGTAARHAIHFDVPLGSYAFNTIIERMFIEKTGGGQSIRLTNDPGTASGGFSYSQIQYNNLESIYFDLGGDGNTFQGNVIGATGTNAAVRVSFVPGAGGFLLSDNVITALNGHVLMVDGNGVVIQNNYIETPPGANTYGFLVDICTGGVMLSPQLVGNQYSVLAGSSDPVPVRIRTNTYGARLADMRYLIQAGNHVQIDAGAVDTIFDRTAHCLTANIVVPPAVANGSTSTGFVGARGTSINDAAAPGYIGEYVYAELLIGSAVPATSGAPANIGAISLTPGDWDVTGAVATAPAGATTTSFMSGWVSSVSVTFPSDPQGFAILGAAMPAAFNSQIAIPTKRFSLSVTTTVYLEGAAVFAGGTLGLFGYIAARRMR